MTSLAMLDSDVEVPFAITEIIDSILDDMDAIEIENHSDDVEDWLTLSDMAHSTLAKNNCHSATYALFAHIMDSVGIDPNQRLGAVEMTYRTGSHWANLIEQDGEQWIVDFTARQFSSVANNDVITFPMVLPIGEWTKTIDRWIMDGYGQSRDSMNIAMARN